MYCILYKSVLFIMHRSISSVIPHSCCAASTMCALCFGASNGAMHAAMQAYVKHEYIKLCSHLYLYCILCFSISFRMHSSMCNVLSTGSSAASPLCASQEALIRQGIFICMQTIITYMYMHWYIYILEAAILLFNKHKIQYYYITTISVFILLT